MRVSALSDQELIRRYIRGEENCFEELVNRHKDKLFTYLLLLTKDRDLAEDMFQETFFKIVQMLKAGRYYEDGKFKPYMMKIAHNIFIDHYRRKQHMPMQHATDEFDPFDIIRCENQNREEMYVQDALNADLKKLIALLPEEKREILLMRIYAKMPFKEIAWVMEISINTALGRMRYALIHLRQLMHQHNIKLVA